MREIVGIVSQFAADSANADTPSPDAYLDRLIKLVPAESITTYTAVNGIVSGTSSVSPLFDWFVFIVVVIGTPVYFRLAHKGVGALQMTISTVAFIVFVLAQGAVFQRHIPDYSTVYGAILVPLVVFIAPLLGNERFS